MKIEKSNNPAAVGALIVVLVLIIGRIFAMVLGHSRTAAAATRTSISSASPGVVSAPSTRATSATTALTAASGSRPAAAATSVSTRNPFTVVAPAPQAPARRESQSSRDHEESRTGTAAVPLMPLPPFPVRALQPSLGESAKSPALPRGGISVPIPSKLNGQDMPPLTLTAIVGGTEPWQLCRQKSLSR